jgi:cysteine desulfurase family protein (TIGR01976 family)
MTNGAIFHTPVIMTAFPIADVRAQFPALASGEAFLDNPAGTQVPQRVIDAVAAAMAGAASNLGGRFRASRVGGAIYEDAHEAMADLLGAAHGGEIVLGQSTTMLTFHMSRAIGCDWRPGDEIVVTSMDHEGNVAPWLRLAADKGVTVRWLRFDRDSWRIEPEALAALMGERTRLVALTYASNLTGSINPIAELTAIAKAAGALVWIDAVQFAPHGKVEVASLGCDFLACSAYKFFGPHLGVLWGRENLLAELDGYRVRCAPTDTSGRHELGTSQIELFAGLTACADYMAWLGEAAGASGDRRARIAAGYAAASAYEMPLAQRMIDGLRAIEGVEIYGITNPNRMSERVPTVSIGCAGRRNSDLAQALADQGVNVWSGHNYALGVVEQLGLDSAEGVLRIGLAHYNTAEEVDRVVGILGTLLG